MKQGVSDKIFYDEMHTYRAERCWAVGVRKEIHERPSTQRMSELWRIEDAFQMLLLQSLCVWILFISSDVSPTITDAQGKYSQALHLPALNYLLAMLSARDNSKETKDILESFLSKHI